MSISRLVTIIFAYLMPLTVGAADLGVIGQTYPILEIDFLDFVQTRLGEMQKNGELLKIQNKFKENVNRHADRPNRVQGITKATTNKSWLVDPSITVPYDLKDTSGRIFARKGTTVNPLTYITIHHPMVFINGDDKQQVNWVVQGMQGHLKNIKLVLVNGSVSEMTKHFQQPIYFDQEGRLTAKFRIRHVPAIVEQSKQNLKVTEIAI